MTETINVGFIGLGQMGGAMAERLLCPEIALHVFDPATAAIDRLTVMGAVGHSGPASVAGAADLVLACLPSPDVSEAVALGLDGVAAGQAIKTYVEMSTIGCASMERIGAGLARHGIGLVDGPISGGPPGARAGTLAIMTSGPADHLLRAAPALERIGRTIHYVGERPGQAQMMKLVNNLVVAANMASLFEALVLGAKAGLDADSMVAVLNASTGRSMVSAEIVPRSVLTGTFDFGASVAIMEKDVSLGLAEASRLSVPMWTLEQSARLWRFAMTQGRTAEDLTALIQVMEGWAGVSVRSTPAP
jgi:3-hydroxyisobutyrate dehydrogenase-like beta-hydroxyacid dehydrogenase